MFKIILHAPFIKVQAMALWPFILIKEKNYKYDLIIMNHECIHLRQQVELLIIPFYLWYGINYLINLIKYKNNYNAYFAIIFEKEAYQNEHNLHYLSKRKVWSFLKYC